ncbi:HPP family protein [Sphingomonas mollis]|uniref:HPP family protein n=1 Tax=Sphingomonas mollis TaxID=2795726 RepID=A0ABS0XS72_9SPHN|nr:HPP family protein [Sphingomonas sp. BT553]MBJ6122640.1 HPP family protein [Sphingomonas sp. BT553]
MPRNLFRPILAGAQFPDRLLACIGAAVCITLTMVVCAQLPLTTGDLPIIVAPLGASAVLVFAVPASPLAQPWPVVGGNIISTLIGVAAFHAIPQVTIAAGIAVGGAILVMSLLRCLHPPGGAAALTAVIGSHGIHDAGYAFAFAPVGINSIALVSLATVFHRMTARNYPHQPMIAPGPVEPQPDIKLHSDDIDAALADMHDSFDIGREDLDLLLARAEHHAATRRMTRPPRQDR